MERNSKRRLFGAFCVLGVILFSLIIFYACNDFGVEADFFCCNIRGEIIINTVVPKNTDEIRVAVTKNYPPTDILSLIWTPERLPVKIDTNVTTQSVPFDLLVPMGAYAAVFAIWKEKNESFSPTDIIGLYGDLLGNEPIPISIGEEDSIAEDIDIDIDFSKVIRNAKIEGRITYVNESVPVLPEEWPRNTGIVAIGAFNEIPGGFIENNFSLEDMNSENPFSAEDFDKLLVFEQFPIRVEQFDYRLRVSSADVKLVALFWIPEGAILEVIERIQVLGFYRDPNLPEQPGKFSIEENETVSGIDIIADFATCLECEF
ncbi:MAG: hypothetical protein ACE5JB_05380 [bacterium]